MIGLAAGLLLLSYSLMMSSIVRKSATVDEQSHLFRGAAYLFAGATHFQLGHPLLGSTLSALPLLTEPAVELPLTSDAWTGGNWSVAGDQFLWLQSANPLRFLFLGRIVVIWLTLGLGALVCRWGRQLGGWAAGTGAAALLLLDPNMIAHGRLITDDVPVTVFFVLALYGYWWLWRAVREGHLWWPGLILSGLGVGLAAATKFNAALLVPALLVEGGFFAVRWRDLRPLTALVPILLLAWLVVGAVYRFELWHGFLPGGAFWDDVLWYGAYAGKEHGGFLLGAVSGERQWSYFPVALAVKTPLTTLVLMGLAGAIAIVRRNELQLQDAAVFLFVLPVLYLAASMVAALNIGYRYLLPMLPFLFLFVAVVILGRRVRGQGQAIRSAAVLVILLGGIRAASVWPDYLSFFNVAVGDKGWRVLADSNVDWGQDLPALARWQQDAGAIDNLYLSYFGTAHPSAYGVTFTPLPTWAPAPEQRNPAFQIFNPADPAPGLYAISVNNLHGFVLGEARDIFAGFKEKQPIARLGGSLFVYEVPVHGQSANLALSGLTPADLDAALMDALDTNDLRVRWFDHTTSFVWPAGGGWIAHADTGEAVPALQEFWPESPIQSNGGQVLYKVLPDTRPSWLQPYSEGSGPLRFRGVQRLTGEGSDILMLTAWEVVEEASRPLKLFVHALDSGGEILGQWDGMGVEPSGWWPGDVFVQSHSFDLPEPGLVAQFRIGVYDGGTMERLTEFILEYE